MKIKSINIKNFKSIVDITINEPNPFTVFVGPNGSGKSNIFEALEYYLKFSENEESKRLFGGDSNLKNFNNTFNARYFNFEDEKWSISIDSHFLSRASISIEKEFNNIPEDKLHEYAFDEAFIDSLPDNNPIKIGYKKVKFYKRQFQRVFINNRLKQKINYSDNSRLTFSCDNLEKVLNRILQNPILREEILDYLRMLIPELENIKIITDEIDGDSKLRIYEKFSKKPFNKALISDGTYNILCLLTAVYQSDEPQFLCIEEPENGLSPYAIETLVGLFRSHCQDYGHYIWLNTHSQTLVRNLKPEEFILVDKIEGETRIKQFKAEDLEGWRMDEAWLTNALGGGLPW